MGGGGGVGWRCGGVVVSTSNFPFNDWKIGGSLVQS